MKDALGHGSNAHDYAFHRAHNAGLTATVEQHARAMDKYPRGPLGLPPEHIRTSTEYRMEKANLDRAVSALRDHNGFMVKNFKKEMKTDRDARRGFK